MIGFLFSVNKKLKAKKLPKESLDHELKGTFLPEFVKMRVVNETFWITQRL